MKSFTQIFLLFIISTLVVIPSLFSSSSSSNTVLAGSPPCNCYHGSIKYSSPRCVCECETDWLQPFCSFQALDTVRIEVWFDLAPSRFISDDVIAKLKANLQPLLANSNTSTGETVDLNKITFLYIKPSYNEKTLALFDMPGGAVNWLYHYTWNVENRTAAWPYANIKISGVYLTEEVTEPDSFVTSILQNTYLYNDGEKIVISLGDMIWLIGAILVVIFIPLVEVIWSTNDEKEIQQDLATGRLDPVYHPSQKYVE